MILNVLKMTAQGLVEVILPVGIYCWLLSRCRLPPTSLIIINKIITCTYDLRIINCYMVGIKEVKTEKTLVKWLSFFYTKE